MDCDCSCWAIFPSTVSFLSNWDQWETVTSWTTCHKWERFSEDNREKSSLVTWLVASFRHTEYCWVALPFLNMISAFSSTLKSTSFPAKLSQGYDLGLISFPQPCQLLLVPVRGGADPTGDALWSFPDMPFLHPDPSFLLDHGPSLS